MAFSIGEINMSSGEPRDVATCLLVSWLANTKIRNLSCRSNVTDLAFVPCGIYSSLGISPSNSFPKHGSSWVRVWEQDRAAQGAFRFIHNKFLRCTQACVRWSDVSTAICFAFQSADMLAHDIGQQASSSSFSLAFVLAQQRKANTLTWTPMNSCKPVYFVLLKKKHLLLNA